MAKIWNSILGVCGLEDQREAFGKSVVLVNLKDETQLVNEGMGGTCSGGME